ncbi:vitamin K epoxide reductase family protein [Luteolibacter luteus]|uniref:Vitamin K epoxide reductase family protein n=1 Tax=Luteolibacter luteus TaxID=2728835 RepID=A0A858RNC5_9BACT|nr:vitamin K epoxide reductase family protein [Luteolibacter luteus]QJE97463.1 vitamin K epoxide reductase family protein [Luteolibacter luteus]
MMALRLSALAGLLLSGWLLFQKASGSITYLVGCGAGSGCANVLGSRWSQWFLVPVTALSLLMYAALLFFTFKPRRLPLLAIGTCLAGAALWFGIIQAFILHSFCPWCLGAHMIGLICAILIFRGHGSRQAGPLKPGLLAGLGATALLVAGQVFGPVPDTHQETQVVLEKEPEAGATPAKAENGPVHSRGEGRKVTFLGNKQYNIDTLPHIGDAKAPHVLVKYYDYACNACRDLHEDLNALMQKHPGKFCIIVLPCPINKACNPNVPAHIPDHANACELAKLALACWRTDPSSFTEVHHALFARPVLDLPKAMEVVKPLMKKPLTADALNDPWIAEVLAADSEDYKRINFTINNAKAGEANYLMPKLLVGGTRMLHGVTKTREILFGAIEQEFKLTGP